MVVDKKGRKFQKIILDVDYLCNTCNNIYFEYSILDIPISELWVFFTRDNIPFSLVIYYKSLSLDIPNTNER